MISKEHESQILQSGINFMRTLTQAYGAEVGMQLWDAIANTLDPDIKGKIFIALLTGEYDDQLTIKLDLVKYSTHLNRVDGIKAIRTVTGLGLKESKDIHDNLALGMVEKINIDPSKRTDAMVHLASVYIMAH